MIAANIQKIREETGEKVKLVAVSKTRSVPELIEAYEAGQRAFGENRVQEMIEKQPLMPADTEWHMIGHLQSNKIKYIAPFVYLIHSIDSVKLLQAVNREAQKAGRQIGCLLQVHIAAEETKFGFDAVELESLLKSNDLSSLYRHVQIRGLMGMATNTDDEQQVRREFRALKGLFDRFSSSFAPEAILSMGMSSDYRIAVEEGSTLIRVGSSIFGERGAH